MKRLLLCLFLVLAAAAAGRAADPLPTRGLSVDAAGRLQRPAGSLRLDDPAFGGTLATARLNVGPRSGQVAAADDPRLLYAYRDFTAEATAAIDVRLAGKTASAGSINLFSTRDDAAGIYVRNPAVWSAGLDLTCVSVWNSEAGAQKAGTAVTPKHVVFAHHFFPANGTTLRFVDGANNVVTRTLVSSVQIGNTDIQVGTLDSDLPATITPAQVLPATTPASFSPVGTPVLYTNQVKEARVAEIIAFSPSLGTIQSATTPGRTAWTVPSVPAIGGDSGSPVFLLFGGRPVLWFCFDGANNGPTVGSSAAAINAGLPAGYALMAALLPSIGGASSGSAVVQSWDGASNTSVSASTTIFRLTPNGATTPIAASPPRQVALPTPSDGQRLTLIFPPFGPGSIQLTAPQGTTVNDSFFVTVVSTASFVTTYQVITLTGRGSTSWTLDSSVVRLGTQPYFAGVGVPGFSVDGINGITLGDGDGGSPVWQDANGSFSFTNAAGFWDGNGALSPVQLNAGQAMRLNTTGTAGEAFTPARLVATKPASATAAGAPGDYWLDRTNNKLVIYLGDGTTHKWLQDTLTTYVP